MHMPALTRGAVAAALVLGAALAVLGVLLMPDFSGGQTERLQAIAEGQPGATVSAVSFTVSQLFLAVGVVGLARLLRRRAPVLSTLAVALTVAGAFGHAVHGGLSLVMVSMAQDLDALDVHAAVLTRLEEGLGLPFMAAGLLGTVLGFLLLGLALWRSGVGPRWVGPATLVWVVTEFALSGISQWASYGSAVLYAAILVALALVVRGSALDHWRTAAEAADAQGPSDRLPVESGSASS